MEQERYETEIWEAAVSQAIGRQVMEWFKCQDYEALAGQVNQELLRLVGRIKEVLDDESMDDAACFSRIDAIVEAFRQTGIGTSRHDW